MAALKPPGKQVAQLTALLFVVFLVALSAFVQGVNVRLLRKDQMALWTIKQVPKTDELKRGFPEGAYAWLEDLAKGGEGADAPLFARNMAARNALVAQLTTVGWSPDAKHDARVDGRFGLVGAGAVTGPFSVVPDQEPGWNAWLNGLSDKEPVGGAVMRHETVAEAVWWFEWIGRPRRYWVVTSLEPAPASGDGPPRRLGSTLLSVGVAATPGSAGARVVASLLSAPPTGNGQSAPAGPFTHEHRAEVSEVEGPPLVQMVSRTEPGADAEDLLANARQRARLVRLYGTLPIGNAEDVVGRNIAATYEAVSILGVTVPAEYLLFGVGIATICVLLALVVIAARARRAGTDPLASDDEEGLWLMILHPVMGRWALWFAMPVAALAAAYPAWGLDPLGLSVFWPIAACVLVLALAAIAAARPTRPPH